MSTTRLSQSQKSILRTLIEQTGNDTQLVKGEEIAADIGTTPGSIRQEMQGLRALQLVEGVPGPRGGYKPTATAYRRLDVEAMDDPAEVPVERNDEPVDGVTVTEIDLSTVHSPELCRAAVTLDGSVRRFSTSDDVAVGPTPAAGLRLTGTVADVTPSASEVIVDVHEMRTG